MLTNDLSRRGRTTRILVTVVAVTCLSLSACGGDSDDGSGSGGVDLSELEAKLVEMQEAKSPNLAVEGADCPDDVELSEGTTFECIVTIEGVQAPYAITLTEDDPEAEVGSFHIEPAKPIIDVSLVVDFIQGQLQGAGDAEVECGAEKVIVTEVGGTFDCTVTSGGDVETLEMVVKDLEGTVGFNN